MVGEVRGLGPMMLAELVRDRQSKEPLPAGQTLDILREAVTRGVVLIRAGLYSNCIRLLPPLIISEEMLREGLDAVERAIEASMTRAAAPA